MRKAKERCISSNGIWQAACRKGKEVGKYLEKAKEIRNNPDVHYNCAQAVLAAFAPDAGITDEQAFKIGANFGNGMKMAATCGAVTGGLMVLGLYGIEDTAAVGTYLRTIRENHKGCLDCGDLLRMNKEAGGKRKPHCDGMVYECVELVEKMIGK